MRLLSFRSLTLAGWCGKMHFSDAGWSSLVARRAHNPKVVGSNPAPATKFSRKDHSYEWSFLVCAWRTAVYTFGLLFRTYSLESSI